MSKTTKEAKPKRSYRTKKSDAASQPMTGIYSTVVLDANGRPDLIIDWEKLKEHVRKCGREA